MSDTTEEDVHQIRTDLDQIRSELSTMKSATVFATIVVVAIGFMVAMVVFGVLTVTVELPTTF